MEKALDSNLYQSSWIDGVQRSVRVRIKALPELKEYIQEDNFNVNENDRIPLNTMIALFEDVIFLFFLRGDEDDDGALSEDELARKHTFSDLLINKDYENHSPIPVYSYMKPHLGTRFILHIMLS